ncbi:hypothetical protein VN97_g10303, partial [Penicillium thymicola]
ILFCLQLARDSAQNLIDRPANMSDLFIGKSALGIFCGAIRGKKERKETSSTSILFFNLSIGFLVIQCIEVTFFLPRNQ